MARPKTISDDELLSAARAMFLEHGYAVPVSVIARHAGVSSAAIFLRYPTKEELFHRVIISAFETQVLAALPDLDAEQDPERALTLLARTLLVFFRQNSRLVLLRAAAGSSRMCNAVGEDGSKGPTPILSSWFTRQMDAGHFRRCDPTVNARIFCATLGHYAMAEATGLPRLPAIDPEAYIAEVVAFSLHGLLKR